MVHSCLNLRTSEFNNVLQLDFESKMAPNEPATCQRLRCMIMILMIRSMYS